MLIAALFMRARVLGISPSWYISRGPLNTSDLRSPLKKNGLLISPDMKKKNSFLSLILMRPSNNFSVLYLKLFNVNILWSSLTVTLSHLSNLKNILVFLYSVSLSFHSSKQVPVSVSMPWPSLYLYMPPQTCFYFLQSPVS